MNDPKKYFESSTKFSLKMALLITAVLIVLFLIWKIKSIYSIPATPHVNTV